MLTCKDCGKRFTKESWKGRWPVRCPECRENLKQVWRDNKNKEK